MSGHQHLNLPKTHRLVIMMVLVVLFMLAELITGYWCHSLALVADAFHMISDFMALIVGLVATRIAKKPKSSRNTFGWQRAEVMGSLINSVMLIALCFTILINAVERFISVEEINDPRLMFYVGVGGLVVNILGLIITGGHGHSHGPAPVEGVVEELRQDIVDCEKMEVGVNSTVTPNGNIGSYEAMDSEFLASNVPTRRKLNCCSCFSTLQYLRRPSDADQDHENCHLAPCRNIKPRKGNKETRSMNMQAVFLHILADFFGSVIVVTCALVIWLVPGDPQDSRYKWKLYLDPCLSICMVLIISISTIPLTLKSILILLQSVPREICVKNLKNRIEKIEGIVKIHDLHVWRLQPDCIIGTVHLRIRGLPKFDPEQVKALESESEGEEEVETDDDYEEEAEEYEEELEKQQEQSEDKMEKLVERGKSPGKHSRSRSRSKSPSPKPDYVEVARKVKAIFHENNIHCTTIQPEFEDGTTDNPEECLYDCGPDETCCPTTCCATQNQEPSDTSNANNLKRTKNGASSVTPTTVVVSPVEVAEVTISLRDGHQGATEDGNNNL
ncbi:unnamed protein product [Hymenolepis diminuta]|uniref:Zinc/cadmium resistance protein n=1 Tax=Hymenolepis diminuta TaxID=6216 RepID=A0A158QBH3_HYMDI|nr:unnamed protein product [Hymenolepis diminuta]